MTNLKYYQTDFIEHLKGLIDYVAKQTDLSEKEKMTQLVFGILVAIDGEANDIGPYMLKPMKETEKWGPDIAGDLHNLFYKIPPRDDIKLPENIIIAIDSAGVHICETVRVEHKDLAVYDGKRLFSLPNGEIKRQMLSLVRGKFPKKKSPRKTSQSKKTD